MYSVSYNKVVFSHTMLNNNILIQKNCLEKIKFFLNLATTIE